MRPGCLGVGGTIRRGRIDDVGGAACTFLVRRQGARRDEDGGVGVGHVFELLIEDCYKIVSEGRAGTANAEQVLLEAVVVVVEDGIGGSQFER